MTRRFLVTGAAGFVGANLCRALVARGEEVHAVLGPSSDAWRLADEALLSRHSIDVCDGDAVQRIVNSVRPDVIYHLAAHGAYPFQTDVDQILRANVLGLWNVLRACESIAYTLFVHAGSSSEYGRKLHPMRENDVLEPNSVYAVSKTSQSLLCQHWAQTRGRPIVVLRLFSVYGPFEEPTRLMPHLMAAMTDDQPLSMTSPRTSRDFVYVDDVIETLLRIDRLLKSGGEIINLGTGVQHDLAEVIAAAEKVCGHPLRVQWNSMEPRQWDSDTWVADVTKLRDRIGYVPKTTLTEGLSRFLAWFRTHRRHYAPERATTS